MGGAEQFPYYLLSLFFIDGLADYPAVKIHYGIGTDYQRIAELAGNALCLRQGQSLGIFARRQTLSRKIRFVYLRRNDPEFIPGLG